MDRKEFISMLGLGAAGVIIPTCMQSCSKDDDNSSGSTVTVDKNLDLTSSEYQELNIDGGFKTLLPEGILVINKGGNFYAVTSVCPHEQKQLTYSESAQKVNCTNHTDQFYSVEGISEGQQTPINLKVYTCIQNGDILKITG